MTPDNYVKTMKRLVTLDETQLFAAFLDQKAISTANSGTPISVLNAEDAVPPKVAAAREQMGLIGHVLEAKYGIHLS